MAQLRNAQTSALLYEADSEQAVLVADQLGPANVLFDDVGLGFNPDAVRQAFEQNLDGLQGAAATETDPEIKASIEQAYAAAKAKKDNAAQIAAGITL